MANKYRMNLVAEFRVSANLISNYCKVKDWDGVKRFLNQLKGYLLAGYELELLYADEYFEFCNIIEMMQDEYLDIKYGTISA